MSAVDANSGVTRAVTPNPFGADAGGLPRKVIPDQFADARVFLPKVVPFGTGYVNIHWSYTGSSKLCWNGRACTDVDEAISAISFALRGKDTQGVYFCTSAQRLCKERVSKRGHKYKEAKRSGADATAFKSIAVDIDSKDYGGDKQMAWDAFEAAYEKIGLKPSVVVDSGNGYHAYFTVAEAMTPAQWSPLAHALKNALLQCALKFDSGCTTDAARILRVPGTVNKKHGRVVPVRLLPVRGLSNVWS